MDVHRALDQRKGSPCIHDVENRVNGLIATDSQDGRANGGSTNSPYAVIRSLTRCP